MEILSHMIIKIIIFREITLKIMSFVSIEGKTAKTSEELIELLKGYPGNLPIITISPAPAESRSDDKTLIFTDGSYKKKTSTAGWAFVVVRNDNEIFRQTDSLSPDEKVTNNVAELTAILKALQYCKISSLYDSVIYSDSEYSINSTTRWYNGWKKNGWRKGDGGEIQNLKLIQEIHSLLDDTRSELKHIKAHKGHKWNELVDKLANSKTI